MIINENNLYCPSLTTYKRRETIEVKIGDLNMGAQNPIRIQSMTTADTMDTAKTVDECLRLIHAGCEYIRITAPSVKEAENLQNIKNELRKLGHKTPLIADIHFTPNAAELAAKIVEKVRINPGNYADRKRFEIIDYTESAYQMELDKIRDKFVPLVKICKEYGTAMRIGSNHGSLSDRIMNKYGDNPLGMVESALEFLRIAEDEGYFNIVLSMKSSNPKVMVEAYRLLVLRLEQEKLKPYPLHLGVTEAGDGEDGRIKSAIGIGTLLEDGLGDTVRVSLTEDPEFEIPVAQKLVNRYNKRAENQGFIPEIENIPINPFQYKRRETFSVLNIGGDNVPRVIADFSDKYPYNPVEIEDLKDIGHFYLPATDKWAMNDLGADYIYLGTKIPNFMLPNGLKGILDWSKWRDYRKAKMIYPLFTAEEYNDVNLEFNLKFRGNVQHPKLNFVSIKLNDILEESSYYNIKDAFMNALETGEIGELKTNVVNDLYENLKDDDTVVLVIYTENTHALPELRRLCFELLQRNIKNPVIIHRKYEDTKDTEQIQIDASVDAGGLFVDGFGDGLMLTVNNFDEYGNNINPPKTEKMLNSLSFGILQGTRTRMSKTEYISCPSCGRTLFDLQETTAKVRQRTDHLKGVKIAIMGCIVNGPGEMADADYGYVGSGKGKITLYRGQNIVKRTVAEENAVDELINLIKEDGKWVMEGVISE